MHVTDEMVDLVREAIRFSVQAAGDGFCAAESFLFNYSTASGDEDWETLADRVSAALRAAPQCCMCGKTGLSTVEGDGGSECQLSDGRWTCSFECWERATGRDAPPPPVVDGWVMVPKDEMTDAMMDAGQAYLDDKSLNGRFRLPGGFNWHRFWHAMLAAAPPAPEQLIASSASGKHYSVNEE